MCHLAQDLVIHVDIPVRGNIDNLYLLFRVRICFVVSVQIYYVASYVGVYIGFIILITKLHVATF